MLKKPFPPYLCYVIYEQPLNEIASHLVTLVVLGLTGVTTDNSSSVAKGGGLIGACRPVLPLPNFGGGSISGSV